MQVEAKRHDIYVYGSCSYYNNNIIHINWHYIDNIITLCMLKRIIYIHGDAAVAKTIRYCLLLSIAHIVLI